MPLSEWREGERGVRRRLVHAQVGQRSPERRDEVPAIDPQLQHREFSPTTGGGPSR